MATLIELNCSGKYCGKLFSIEKRKFVYNRKQNPDANFFCCEQCRRVFSQKRHDEICARCSAAIIVRHTDWEKSKTKLFFCTQSCAAKFNNSKRKESSYTTKDKIKDHTCTKCLSTFVGSIHLGSIKLCPVCQVTFVASKNRIQNRRNKVVTIRLKIDRDKKSTITIPCAACGITFSFDGTRVSVRNKCDSCKHLACVRAGTLSAQARGLTSKNENLFGKRLKELMPLTDMLYNTKYFPDGHGNEWDADIIIPEMKLAIHWNGKWHYEYCGGKHSVLQVQNRDKIKNKAVKSFGYKNYTIKDMGKFSLQKVELEVEKFLLTFFL